MTYLPTPDESPLYAEALAERGYVPEYTRVFALAPAAYQGWLELGSAVKAGMDERRYELVTVVAAQQLGSRPCTLAHSAVLREKYYDAETFEAIVKDRHRAGLDPTDVAALDFAERIAADPRAATPHDIAQLRHSGLSDVDIVQVVLAVAARRFFTGVLAALGVESDPVLDSLDVAALATGGMA